MSNFNYLVVYNLFLLAEGLEEIFDFVTYGDDSERSDGSGMWSIW